MNKRRVAGDGPRWTPEPADRHRPEGRCRSRSSSACLPSSRRPGSCRPARSSSSAPSSRCFRSWPSSPAAANCAAALDTNRPLSHIARGLVGVSAMGLGFFALTRLPLPEAITLNYAQPLLVVVFSALFLGETIRIYRWSAVAVGLVGVFIISWPKLTLARFAGRHERPAKRSASSLPSWRPAFRQSRCCWSATWCAPRKTATIVLWFSLTASVVGAADAAVRLAGAHLPSRPRSSSPRASAAASRRS